jgi:putative transposase
MDVTYIRLARGFVYLAVVLDWFSRRVLSWRISITVEAALRGSVSQSLRQRVGGARIDWVLPRLLQSPAAGLEP